MSKVIRIVAFIAVILTLTMEKVLADAVPMEKEVVESSSTLASEGGAAKHHSHSYLSSDSAEEKVEAVSEAESEAVGEENAKKTATQCTSCPCSEPAVTKDLQIVEMTIGYTYQGTEVRETIEIALFNKQYPVTTTNFRKLCEGITVTRNGKTQTLNYDNVPFHRIVDEFVVQGGDIMEKNGRGSVSAVSPHGREFPDEKDALNGEGPARTHSMEGMVAMANRGPNTNGSQFYFTLGPKVGESDRFFAGLNGKHTVFGKIIKGMPAIREIVRRYNEHAFNDSDMPKILSTSVTCRHATEEDVNATEAANDSEAVNGSEAANESDNLDL
ncbi:peptidyl-prolyl isomerase D [Nematocida displodere]|uniref:peptidylprolyl isomerase n=1 Tax=Nematocida displodere TaxID=1805483 RepID=A0A177ECC2_9MICR|nr:peptidyl-prolyl isomerase D [Nematocida displodere]